MRRYRPRMFRERNAGSEFWQVGTEPVPPWAQGGSDEVEPMEDGSYVVTTVHGEKVADPMSWIEVRPVTGEFDVIGDAEFRATYEEVREL